MIRITFGIGIGEDRFGRFMQPHNIAKFEHEAVKQLTIQFGGCFIVRGHGGWLDQGRIVIEPGIQIVVIAEQATMNDAKRAAVRLKQMFDQTAVLMTYEEIRGEYV